MSGCGSTIASNKTCKPRGGNPMFGINREPWMTEGLCTQVGASLFFPEDNENATEARRVCSLCTVSEACLDYALRNNEGHGVFGGHSLRERRKIARDRQAAEEAA